MAQAAQYLLRSYCLTIMPELAEERKAKENVFRKMFAILKSFS